MGPFLRCQGRYLIFLGPSLGGRFLEAWWRDNVKVRVRRLEHAGDLPLPTYMTPGSSGMDLVAAVGETVSVAPGEIRMIPTGLILEIPTGYEGQIRPRSGLACKYGISIPNAPGTIDSDYRGEVQIILINLGKQVFAIDRGDRIAQLVICRTERVELVEVAEVSQTARNQGGFGHTGQQNE